MKHLFKSICVVALSAMALTACSKDEIQEPNLPEQMTTIQITASSAQTKTHFDGSAKIKWDATGEEMMVVEKSMKRSGNSISSTTNVTKTSGVTVSEDGLTAQYQLDVKARPDYTSFNYWGVYPAQQYISVKNTDIKKFKVQVPSSQQYVQSSFDPNADMLISKGVELAEQPTSLNLVYHRPIALVHLQLEGITAGEKIQQVVLKTTTKDQYLSGAALYNLMENTLGACYDGKQEIILACDGVEATGSDDVYMTAYPVNLTDFTVLVATDKATYEKKVDAQAKPLVLTANTLSQVKITGLDAVRSEELTKMKIATPTNMKFSTSNNGSKLTISWTAPTDGLAHSYTVTCGDLPVQKVTETKASFSHLQWITKYDVSVVANPDPASKQYESSDPLTGSKFVGMEPLPTAQYLTDGDYVILCKAGDKYFALGTTVKQNETLAAVQVDYDGVAASYKPQDESLVWTLKYDDLEMKAYTIANKKAVAAGQESVYLNERSTNGRHYARLFKTNGNNYMKLGKISEGVYSILRSNEVALSLQPDQKTFTFDLNQNYAFVIVPIQ